jgi:hypothetical protein
MDDYMKKAAEFLERQNKLAAQAESDMAQYRAERGPHVVYRPPPAPTFDQVDAFIKRAWDQVEKTIPTAPVTVKVLAFQALLPAAANDSGPTAAPSSDAIAAPPSGAPRSTESSSG